MKKVLVLIQIMFLGITLMAVEIPFKTTRLGKNVLLIGTTTDNSNMVVLNTKKGLVFIDCLWSPTVVKEAQKIIEKEFGKKKIFLLIHTNASILQSGGASFFTGVERIAHVDLKEILQQRIPQLETVLNQRVEQYKNGNIPNAERIMKKLDKKSKRYLGFKDWINTLKRWTFDMEAGYKILLPTKTFNSRLKVDCGDIKMELIYFGQASRKGGATVIKVEDENLLILGDLFHGGHILPYGPYNEKKPAVSRWIRILQELTDESSKWKSIVRSNGNMLSVEDLKIKFRLIKDIKNKVNEAAKKNVVLEELLNQVSDVKKEFPYLSSGGSSDIRNVVKGLWRKIRQSGVDLLRESYEKAGISAAKTSFSKIKKNSKKYYFLSGEFNSFGYYLSGSQKYNDAFEIFKMGIEIYPESSNLYDSFAEILLKSGNKKEAIKKYEKSLELNPNNANAKKVLKEIKEVVK